MHPPIDDTLAVLQAFGLSVAAFLVIVSFHLVGLHGAARLVRPKRAVTDQAVPPFFHTVIFIVTVMSILFTLHLLTNFAWALFMRTADVLPNYRDCVFYSLENYTGLGLTRVNVEDHWRMLAPMISLSGIFCLGWSTAVLISVFGQYYAGPSDRR